MTVELHSYMPDFAAPGSPFSLDTELTLCRAEYSEISSHVSGTLSFICEAPSGTSQHRLMVAARRSPQYRRIGQGHMFSPGTIDAPGPYGRIPVRFSAPGDPLQMLLDVVAAFVGRMPSLDEHLQPTPQPNRALVAVPLPGSWREGLAFDPETERNFNLVQMDYALLPGYLHGAGTVFTVRAYSALLDEGQRSYVLVSQESVSPLTAVWDAHERACIATSTPLTHLLRHPHAPCYSQALLGRGLLDNATIPLESALKQHLNCAKVY